ncbi:MAG: nitrous oxide-stimulated promoter family protein [Planctomycetes bacterium]|nr:nitrous oxide-stimulated promoter family protein [Planctomycetota bacterium]
MAEAGNEAESRPERRDDPRIALEKRTIGAMIGIYCRGRHNPGEGICSDCRELLDYALARLDHCPMGGDKSTCARCSVHCYRPEMRSRVKEVMRFAGPRMVYRHPVLALRHRLHSLKQRLLNGRK